MDLKVYLNDGDTLEGEGTVDEMGITVRKPVKVLIAGKENEASMTMIPWTSVKYFDYVVTQEMIDAQNAAATMQQAQGDLTSPNAPNRAARRAANRG